MGIFKARSLEIVGEATPEGPVNPQLAGGVRAQELAPDLVASFDPKLQEHLSRREEAWKAGFYKGKHYGTYGDNLETLIREKQFDEAETLLLGLVEAAEREAAISNAVLPPWYYKKLAIVYRKKKDYDAEVVICERYIHHERPVQHRVPEFAERVERAKAYREKLKAKEQ